MAETRNIFERTTNKIIYQNVIKTKIYLPYHEREIILQPKTNQILKIIIKSQK